MRHDFKTYSLVLTALAAFSFTACSDDDFKGNNHEHLTEVAPLTPSVEDALTVTSNLPAYVLGRDFEGVGLALQRRCVNEVGDLSGHVSTIVISASSVQGITPAQYDVIVRAFNNNANVVVTRPNISQWNTFFEGLANAAARWDEQEPEAEIQSFVDGLPLVVARGHFQGNQAYYIPDGAEQHADEPLYGAVALRMGNMQCVKDMHDADDMLAQLTATSFDAAGNYVSTDSEIREMPQFYTDYCCGLVADNLVQWLNEQPQAARQNDELLSHGRAMVRAEGGTGAVDKRLTAQTITFYGWAFAPESSHLCMVKNDFEVWAVNDLSSHDDYYIVHQTFNAYNDQLQCVLDENGYYLRTFEDGEDWMENGPYMKMVEMESSLSQDLRGFDYTIIDPQPHTQQVNNSLSSGVSFNLGSSVGINSSGPSGGLSGGIGFSQSYSRSLPSLMVENKSDNKVAHWTYTGQTHKWETKVWNAASYHHVADAVQRSTCTMDNTWIWRIPDASQSYTINTSAKMVIEACYELKNNFVTIPKQVRQQTWNQNYSFELTPPNRSLQQISVISDAGKDTGLDEFLRNQYPDIWKTQITIYDYSDKATLAVDDFIDQMQDRFERDKYIWARKGYEGRFKFTVRRGDNDHYYTFTIDNRPR